jgi:dolichol kinase
VRPGAAPAPGAGGRASSEPWRRLVHLASGALGPAAVLAGPAAAPAFAGLLVVAGAAEAARLRSPRAREAIGRVVGALFRPGEAHGISGATTLLLGFAVTWWLFPPAVAARAMVVTAVADPAAATVGRYAGSRGRKSWAGSVACAAAAALVLIAWGVAAPAAGATAVVAAAAERVPWRGVDNVTIPLAVAAALRLLI